MLPQEPFSNPTLDTVFRGQVQESFGGTDYKGLGQRGVSWRALALGQTLPVQRATLPQTGLTRGLDRAIGVPRAPFGSRSLLEPARDWLGNLQLGLIERIPEPVFVRLLELMQYPLAVYQAAREVWEAVATYVGSLTTSVREAGERFLSDAAGMRDRLRAGGLFPEEWGAMNVLSLGVLDRRAWPGWLARARQWLAALTRRLSRHSEPQAAGGLRVRVRHLPFGMDVNLDWGVQPLALSALAADGDLTLFARLDRLPAGMAAPQLLKAHADRVLAEGMRRQRWLLFASRVISLIVTYVVLGPAGFVVLALRLILEGLLEVALNGRLILPAR